MQRACWRPWEPEPAIRRRRGVRPDIIDMVATVEPAAVRRAVRAEAEIAWVTFPVGQSIIRRVAGTVSGWEGRTETILVPDRKVPEIWRVDGFTRVGPKGLGRWRREGVVEGVVKAMY